MHGAQQNVWVEKRWFRSNSEYCEREASRNLALKFRIMQFRIMQGLGLCRVQSKMYG